MLINFHFASALEEEEEEEDEEEEEEEKRSIVSVPASGVKVNEQKAMATMGIISELTCLSTWGGACMYACVYMCCASVIHMMKTHK